jgi:LAGLIDADG-like domain
MIVNREELAWAAGLFDGEGTIGLNQRHISMSMAQVNPEVLLRFQAAVGGLGHVYGPYQRQEKTHSQWWVFCPTSFEHTQAIVAMLWTFLSSPKKEQISKTFKQFEERPRRRAGRKE